MSTIRAVRDATVSLHRHLDTRPIFTKLLARRLTLSDYRQLLTTYYMLYSSAEAEVYGRADLEAVLPDLGQRRKAHWLKHDLGVLSVPIPTVCSSVNPVTWLRGASTFEALGCLYVLEGSTLGGRMVRKIVIKTLGDEVLRASTFFASYGDQIDQRWRDFVSTVNSLQASADDVKAATDAAVRTFECFVTALEALELHDESK